jgi:hypothetical protein
MHNTAIYLHVHKYTWLPLLHVGDRWNAHDVLEAWTATRKEASMTHRPRYRQQYDVPLAGELISCEHGDSPGCDALIHAINTPSPCVSSLIMSSNLSLSLIDFRSRNRFGSNAAPRVSRHQGCTRLDNTALH